MIPLLAITLMVVPINSTVFASEPVSETQTITKELEDGLIIELYEDGRVKPIEYNAYLSEKHLDAILTEIGYPSQYIASKTLETKRYLVSLGGKLVDANVTMKNEYIASDGNVYEITPFNKQEVKEIQIDDLKNSGVSEEEIGNYNIVDDGISIMSCTGPFEGTCQDGKWFGMLMILRAGETQNSYIYRAMLDASWSGTSKINFGVFCK